jgi:hypothetical protein
MEKVAQRNVSKKNRARFNNVWFATTIRAIGE